jgi:hypothetical protein
MISFSIPVKAVIIYPDTYLLADHFKFSHVDQTWITYYNGQKTAHGAAPVIGVDQNSMFFGNVYGISRIDIVPASGKPLEVELEELVMLTI